MVYCDENDLRLMTNLSTSDVSNANVISLITEATAELNRMINVREVREVIDYIDSTRKNSINNSNTTFYVRNWKGKYLADMNNDGDVDTSDIIVYQVDSNGTETTLTVSSVDHDDGKFVLSSAPTTGVRLYVTYEWCQKDVSTPDKLVKMACVFLTASYIYGKINIGRSPDQSWGNKSIKRDMNSPNYYRKIAMKLVDQINDSDYFIKNSEATI